MSLEFKAIFECVKEKYGLSYLEYDEEYSNEKDNVFCLKFKNFEDFDAIELLFDYGDFVYIREHFNFRSMLRPIFDYYDIFAEDDGTRMVTYRRIKVSENKEKYIDRLCSLLHYLKKTSLRYGGFIGGITYPTRIIFWRNFDKFVLKDEYKGKYFDEYDYLYKNGYDWPYQDIFEINYDTEYERFKEYEQYLKDLDKKDRKLIETEEMQDFENSEEYEDYDDIEEYEDSEIKPNNGGLYYKYYSDLSSIISEINEKIFDKVRNEREDFEVKNYYQGKIVDRKCNRHIVANSIILHYMGSVEKGNDKVFGGMRECYDYFCYDLI